MSIADGARPEPGPEAEKSDIQADIEQTRQELGDTTQALAAKLDVPEQARQKVEETKQRVAAKTEPVRENVRDNKVPIAAALAAAALVVGVVVWRRGRS